MLRDVAVARVQIILGFRTDQDANIVQAMQEFQEELERNPELPSFLRKPYVGLATAAAVQTVNVPNDFLREWEQDQMNVATTDGPQSVVKDELGYLRIRYKDSGTPQKYALVDGQFYFFPLPDQVYALSGTYYAKDAILSTNIENKWLKYIPEILIAGSGIALASGLRDQNALQLFAAMQQMAQAKLVSMQVADDAAGAKPIMGGED